MGECPSTSGTMAFDGTPTKLIGDAVAGSKVLATRAQAHWGVVWVHCSSATILINING